MDGKPYRLSRPSERRAAETTHRQEAPQPPVSSQPAQRATSHRASETKKSPKGLMVIIIVLIIIIVAGGGWLGWNHLRNTNVGIDSGRYQAVFLTNGQVYVGKLSSQSNGYMQMTKVYGMQTGNSTDAADTNKQTQTDGGYKLVRLSNGLLGSEDAMTLSRDQILYYENLKPNSKVVQLIKQDDGSH